MTIGWRDREGRWEQEGGKHWEKQQTGETVWEPEGWMQVAECSREWKSLGHAPAFIGFLKKCFDTNLLGSFSAKP